MNISIIYEDSNLLVVDKPAGLIIHPKNSTDKQESLSAWVVSKFPGLKNVGEPFNASGSLMSRCGIVHRLDKETSGLVIISKNQTTFDYFKNLFQTRKISKNYYALVYGQPKESSGIIDMPLGRIGLKRTTRIEGKKLIDKKESVTEYVVVKKFDEYSLLDVSPKTGRTHQIRVHLKHLGCPIVGDNIYAPRDWPKPENLNRLFLHAYKLAFVTPDGKALTLETDLPEELQNVLNTL